MKILLFVLSMLALALALLGCGDLIIGKEDTHRPPPSCSPSNTYKVSPTEGESMTRVLDQDGKVFDHADIEVALCDPSQLEDGDELSLTLHTFGNNKDRSFEFINPGGVYDCRRCYLFVKYKAKQGKTEPLDVFIEERGLKTPPPN